MNAIHILAAMILSLALPGFSGATIIEVLDDGFDDWQLVGTIQKDSRVAELAKRTNAFKKKLVVLKEHHLIALFGKPVRKPSDFAMLCTEPRVVGFSGKRYQDEKLNKNHTDFHIIDDSSGIEVYYGIDGESPVQFQLYKKTDKGFVKLANPRFLRERLAVR